MSGDEPKLTVEAITVAYGDQIVLDELSLEVAPGETVAVVGPSGSGKSTLLRAIAGLEPLRGGRVLLDGRDLAGVPTHRRGVGLMFQDHALFPHLGVADNIAYGLAHGSSGTGPGGHIGERVAEMLALVGLEGFGGRRIDQLSGGEAQRVALARSLAPAPSLLMLDEPLGSLDRVLREQLASDLDLLLNRMGQTSLHVTHDQVEASALGDRLAVLTEGRLVRIGTPQELWDDPGSAFVARFIGRPNIWTLTADGDGNVRLDSIGQPLASVAELAGAGAAHLAHRLRDGGPVQVVVPVDRIGLVTGSPGSAATVAAIGEAGAGADGGDERLPGPAGAMVSLAATVRSTQFYQGVSRYRLEIAGLDADAVAVGRGSRPPGQSVTAMVDLTSMIPLDG